MAIQFNYGICTNRDKDGEGNPCPLCASKERQKLPAGRDFVCRECGEPLQKVKAPEPPIRKYKPFIIGGVIAAVIAIVFLLVPFGDKEQSGGGQEGTGGGTPPIVTGTSTEPGMSAGTDEINAESLAFSEQETEIRLVAGEEKSLNVTCTPDSANETIAYRSENIDVATVSSEGVVKAVGKGTTRITAVTNRTGLSDTMQVVVTEADHGGSTAGSDAGKLNLGFATYEGDTQNGKAHGNGVMTFKTKHVIPGAKDDIEAQAGEYVQGAWRNGEVNLVTLYQKNGNQVKIMHK